VVCYFLARDAIFGGQSIGKRVMGLKVVAADGGPINFARSAVRNIIYVSFLVLAIPVLGLVLNTFISGPLGLIEILSVIFTGKRIGDHIGGTYVTKV